MIKQENSYYPFGLIMPNSQIATPSLANKQLYNGGSEWQNDYGDLPDLYQTYYRSYDAALGRFTGIDPKAELTESLSPYHYAGNNPVLYNDPMGDFYGSNGQYVSDRGISNFKRHQDGGGYANFNNWINKTMERIDDPQAQPFSLTRSMAERNTGAAVAVYADGHIEIDYGMPYSSYNFQIEVDGKLGWTYIKVATPTQVETSPWYDIGSKINAMYGVALPLVSPFVKSSISYARSGTPFLKYYASGWGGGSKAFIRTAKTVKILPYVGFFAGLAMDGVAVKNGEIGWGKFTLNQVMGVAGFSGVLAPLSITYFALDAFYPGGVNGVMKDHAKIYDSDPNYYPHFSF